MREPIGDAEGAYGDAGPARGAPPDCARLLRVLTSSRDALARATVGLTPDQWTARTAPGRWSPRDVVEHLLLTETAVSPRVLSAAAAAAESAAGAGARRRRFGRLPRWAQDRVLVQLVGANLGRAVSPDFVRPRGPGAAPDAMLRAFQAARATLLTFAATTRDDLRASAGPHPYLGPLDRYQWALFLGAHVDRHVAQIRAMTNRR